LRSGIPPQSERRFVSNEVVVGVDSSMSPQAVSDMTRRFGLTTIDQQSVGLSGITLYRLRVDDQRNVADVVKTVENELGVGKVQPNYRYVLQDDLASSPSSGVTAPVSAQYALDEIRVPQAHALANGQGVKVAVIDSGIDVSHPELAGSVVAQFDALGSADPPHIHGTGIASIIAAHDRLVGVAPAASILAARAFSAAGTAEESTTFSVVRSIDWAISQGARVINMSFAGPFDPQIEQALARAHQKNIILVAAAGNAGPTSPPLFPASDPDVIAVTAVDSQEKLFQGANRGSNIAVAAPGVSILIAAPGESHYWSMTGTSFAAAHVSGLAALALERDPNLTAAVFRKKLLATAHDLGPKGRDDDYGSGLIDAYALLNTISGPTATAANLPSSTTVQSH
jgi:subtilisin family serine protease